MTLGDVVEVLDVELPEPERAPALAPEEEEAEVHAAWTAVLSPEQLLENGMIVYYGDD